VHIPPQVAAEEIHHTDLALEFIPRWIYLDVDTDRVQRTRAGLDQNLGVVEEANQHGV
jgi:hypothetical protein